MSGHRLGYGPGRWVLLGLTLAVGSSLAQAEVDFERDVRPILEARCVECHSALETNGGLRLDRRPYAFMGGDSGVSALTADLEQNPIWQRISSDDPELRMPFDGEPLPPAELETLRAWIEGGASWPSETEREVVIDFEAQVSRQDAAKDVSTRYLSPKYWFVTTYLRPLAPWLALALLLVLVLARLRSAQRAEKAWAQRPLLRWTGGLTAGALFAVFLSVTCAALAVILVRVSVDRDAEWRQRYAPKEVYGDPPVAQRPAHARRVAGSYWRGNCERHPELFNGGYYTTAILHLDLCDEAGQAVGYGDPLPEALFARLVIERAPNANPNLFGAAMMQKVLLTRHAGPHAPKEPPEDAVRLTTVRDGNAWEARFPLEVEGTGSYRDRAYLYSEVVHYMIDATVVVDEAGRLGPESDVWLGTLYWNGSLAKPQPGRVPLDQWFDHRPMPLIDRANTKDPTLLGEDQYFPEGKRLSGENQGGD